MSEAKASSGFILDTPDQIRTFQILAIIHGLRMEIVMQKNGLPPTACPTKGRALSAARRELVRAGLVKPRARLTRTRALQLVIDNKTELCKPVKKGTAP